MGKSKTEVIIYVIEIVLAIIFIAGTIVWGLLPVNDKGTWEDLGKNNEANIQKVLAGRELPVIENYLDRENLMAKYEFLNQRGHIGWLYVFTYDGVLMIEEPVLNKLTDNDTYLTPMEGIDRRRASSDDPWEYTAYEMSDIDGTYGTNSNGVFWFDPDGNYQELALETPLVIYSGERKSYDIGPKFKFWDE